MSFQTLAQKMISFYLLRGQMLESCGYPYTTAERRIDLGRLTYKDAVTVSDNTAGINNKYYLGKSGYHIPLKLVKGDPSSMNLQEQNGMEWLQSSNTSASTYALGYKSVGIFYRPPKINGKYYATDEFASLGTATRYNFKSSYSASSSGTYYAYSTDIPSGGESTTAYKCGTFEANVSSGHFYIQNVSEIVFHDAEMDWGEVSCIKISPSATNSAALYTGNLDATGEYVELEVETLNSTLKENNSPADLGLYNDTQGTLTVDTSWDRSVYYGRAFLIVQQDSRPKFNANAIKIELTSEDQPQS